jgi:hypothetical protein
MCLQAFRPTLFPTRRGTTRESFGGWNYYNFSDSLAAFNYFATLWRWLEAVRGWALSLYNNLKWKLPVRLLKSPLFSLDEIMPPRDFARGVITRYNVIVPDHCLHHQSAGPPPRRGTLESCMPDSVLVRAGMGSGWPPLPDLPPREGDGLEAPSR